jgi:hypothetical protein
MVTQHAVLGVMLLSPVHTFPLNFVKTQFKFSPPYARLHFPSCGFPSGFMANILSAFLIFPTYPIGVTSSLVL